jgi:hypothetical protein
MAEVVDGISDDDNWITNRSDIDVTVACSEMFGIFRVHLRPGETQRVTFNVRAAPYQLGEYSYDDLKYELGEREKWEVRREQGQLVMVEVGDSPSDTASAEEEQSGSETPPAADWYPDPTGRHQHRYWDGAAWTHHVADNGAASIDELNTGPGEEAANQPSSGVEALRRREQEVAAELGEIEEGISTAAASSNDAALANIMIAEIEERMHSSDGKTRHMRLKEELDSIRSQLAEAGAEDESEAPAEDDAQ